MKNKEKFTTYTYTDVYEYVDENGNPYLDDNGNPYEFPILENKMCSSSAWKKYSVSKNDDLDADDPSTGIAKCKKHADKKGKNLTYVSYDEGSNKYKCYKSDECNYDKYAKDYTTYDVSALYDKSSKHKLAEDTHIYTDYYDNEYNIDILYNKRCSFSAWKKFNKSSVANLNEAIDKCLSYGNQLTYVSYDDSNNKYKCYKTDECNYDKYAKNYTTYDVSNIISENIIKKEEDIQEEEEEKKDYTDLVNSWTNDLDEMSVRDYNDTQCTNVLNSCIHTHYDTRLFNKKNINKLLDFLKIILYILVVCLISYYILSLNLDFKVKLIKLILFIVILVSLKIYHYNFIFSIIVILLLLIYKILYVYKIINDDNNQQQTLSKFREVFKDTKYDVIRFPPKSFFKNITEYPKYKIEAVSTDSNFIKDVFIKWDNFNFFQDYYDDKGNLTNIKREREIEKK
tara:strand:- start:576 stop:1940 length:1365 start_codon:yes stop_codon:yes gene_type:complete